MAKKRSRTLEFLESMLQVFLAEPDAQGYEADQARSGRLRLGLHAQTHLSPEAAEGWRIICEGSSRAGVTLMNGKHVTSVPMALQYVGEQAYLTYRKDVVGSDGNDGN